MYSIELKFWHVAILFLVLLSWLIGWLGTAHFFAKSIRAARERRWAIISAQIMKKVHPISAGFYCITLDRNITLTSEIPEAAIYEPLHVELMEGYDTLIQEDDLSVNQDAILLVKETFDFGEKLFLIRKPDGSPDKKLIRENQVANSLFHRDKINCLGGACFSLGTNGTGRKLFTLWLELHKGGRMDFEALRFIKTKILPLAREELLIDYRHFKPWKGKS